MDRKMSIGVIGNGSWATALVKMLTDNGKLINWWVRNEKALQHIRNRGHNPNYLSSAWLDTQFIEADSSLLNVVQRSELLVIATPSAYVQETLESLPNEALENKIILSAIKGLIPGYDVLLNEYLSTRFGISIDKYYSVLGPCHAEEVAAEKLSYLTFSGIDREKTKIIAEQFNCPYINTVVNEDIIGVQYAAVLKNIYALGAGMAHGLEYGDNFLSVYIANSADEMACFLKEVGAQHMVVGEHSTEDPDTHQKDLNYAASVYLGDLLVTCYSPFSRNRSFGTMIGKGYTVQSAQLEMNMVAEGYNASKCIFNLNQKIGADMPIARTIYEILFERKDPYEGFKSIEKVLV